MSNAKIYVGKIKLTVKRCQTRHLSWSTFSVRQLCDTVINGHKRATDLESSTSRHQTNNKNPQNLEAVC